MNPLPAEILTEIADAIAQGRAYRANHLFELRDGDTVYRWTDAPQAVPYDGNTYTQQPFMLGEDVITDDGDQALDLVFDDIDQIVRVILWTEDFKHRTCTVREVYFSTANNSILATRIVGDGRADPGTTNLEDPAETTTITILPGAEAEGAPGPSQQYTGSCRYAALGQFNSPALRASAYASRGLQCGYPGAETWCDGSGARCRALSNEARFGGFQYAPKSGETIRVGAGNTKVGAR